MTQKKRRLGRALSDMGVQALLSQSQEDIPKDQIKNLPLTDISPNINQPRKTFAEESLLELSESIKTHGVLQPILVTQTPSGQYEIIAGERRFRAAQLAGLSAIPAVVKNLDELARESIAIIENIQREALNPLDQALAYARLIDTYQLSHDDIAAKVNKSRSSITNILRLNKLHPEVKDYLRDGKIEMGHARALLAQPYDKQPLLAKTCIEKGLSVRQVEQLGKAKQQPKLQKPDISWVINTLKRFNYKARMNGNHNKGAITLSYQSPEELEKILSSLTAKSEETA